MENFKNISTTKRVNMKSRKILAILLSITAMLFLTVLVTTQAQEQTPTDFAVGGGNSSITIRKQVCNSIGQQNTCNGNNNALNGQTINFTVTPAGPTNGTIGVLIGNNANGTTTTDGFTTGDTFVVCENVPSGFVSIPRPENSTGGQQTASGNCITVTLGPGNNVLNFLNGPAPTPTPTPTPQTCTPSTTVSEDPSLFPGGIPSFGVTSGPGSVTIDHVNTGTGTQSITVNGVPSNAIVTIPPFTPGTFNPVVVTFTRPNPALPVDFTLRARSTFHGIFIRVRCGIVTTQ
jgi:hypothetical protein